MYLESQEMESFQGWGEVGRIIPIGIGTGNSAWSVICLREVGLQRGLASPFNEWNLGQIQKAHPFGTGARGSQGLGRGAVTEGC